MFPIMKKHPSEINKLKIRKKHIHKKSKKSLTPILSEKNNQNIIRIRTNPSKPNLLLLLNVTKPSIKPIKARIILNNTA